MIAASPVGVAIPTPKTTLDRVQVRYGDTGDAPPNPGAGGSRLTHILGQATADGATSMKARLEERAAAVLGWPGDQTALENDQFAHQSGSAPAVAFDDVVERMLQAGGAEATGTYDSSELGHGMDQRAATAPTWSKSRSIQRPARCAP